MDPTGNENGQLTNADITVDNASLSSGPTAVIKEETVTATSAPPSTGLRRHFSPLIFASLYAVLALWAWAVTCILSFRPIGRVYSYGVNDKAYSRNWFQPVAHLYDLSRRSVSSARIVRSIVDVITLPVATLICAAAAVVYMQQRRRNFSLRQAAVLADRGWIQPKLLARLLWPSNWKRYASGLLWLAILLHAIGFILAPLQQVFVSEKTIQIPNGWNSVTYLTDIPDLFSPAKLAENSPESDLVQYLRYAITNTNRNDVLPSLWLGQPPGCTVVNNTASFDQTCVFATGNTLAGLDSKNDPFIAQLPAQFNTGLIRQFLPRLISSLSYIPVDTSEFPQNCDSLPGAFYVEYSGTDGYTFDNYNIQACMPGNLTHSPWTGTRDRQDIAEVLYLNISASPGGFVNGSGSAYKIQANSTAGYFELPNYLNGGVPGPLIDKDPTSLCDSYCLGPVYVSYEVKHQKTKRSASRTLTPNQTLSAQESDNSIQLDYVLNRGPLLMVAMAVFGESSYIATRTAHPEAYEITEAQLAANDAPNNHPSIRICYDQYPLLALGDSEIWQGCAVLENPGEIYGQVADWVSIFWAEDPAPIQGALNSALYLANEIWLKEGTVEDGSIQIYYDLGTPMSIPVVSRHGMVAISVLLGLFLAGLFAMALYACWAPAWTPTLDSFAMMRIGGSAAHSPSGQPALPLLVGSEADELEVLDGTPGWIGDELPDAAVGRLGLGAPARLKGSKRYESFLPHVPSMVGGLRLAEGRRFSEGG